MPVKCSICQHPNVAEIDSLLDSGEYKKDVALRFHVSAHALSRHGRGLCKVEPDSLQAQATKWRERADQLWQRGTVDEDSRAMAQAVSAGLRSVELQARQKERDAEAATAEKDNDDGRVSVGDLDELVAVLTQASPTPVDRAKIKIVLDRAQAIMRPDGVQLFHRMYEDAQFAESMLDHAASWQPTRKGEPEPEPDEPIQSQETRPN